MPPESPNSREGTDPETVPDEDGTTRRGVLKGAAAAGVLAGAGLGVAALQAEPPTPTVLLGGAVPGWDGVAPQSIAGRANPTLDLVAGQTYRLLWENRDGVPHTFSIEDADQNRLRALRPVAVDRETFDQLANGTAPNGTADNMTVADLNATNVTNVTAPTTTMANATGNETEGVEGRGLVTVTPQVAERGVVQAVEFVASEEMATYRCTIHPSTMVGEIAVQSGSG